MGPLIGLLLGKVLVKLLGFSTLPFLQDFLITLFAGGTIFACVFMITEPISGPVNTKARWIYAILIGFLAAIIRSLSAFNAGFMFSILLGNAFGPIIEIDCQNYEAWRKGKTA